MCIFVFVRTPLTLARRQCAYVVSVVPVSVLPLLSLVCVVLFAAVLLGSVDLLSSVTPLPGSAVISLF